MCVPGTGGLALCVVGEAGKGGVVGGGRPIWLTRPYALLRNQAGQDGGQAKCKAAWNGVWGNELCSPVRSHLQVGTSSEPFCPLPALKWHPLRSSPCDTGHTRHHTTHTRTHACTHSAPPQQRGSPLACLEPTGCRPPGPQGPAPRHAAFLAFQPQSTMSGWYVRRLYRSVVPHFETPRI